MNVSFSVNLDDYLIKENPNLSKQEARNGAMQLLYLAKVTKDSNLRTEMINNFMFSLHNYPNLNLVKRFCYLYGMNYASYKSKNMDTNNMDYEKYLTQVNKLFDEATKLYNSTEHKVKVLGLFPKEINELKDKNNLAAFKLGVDEGFFLTNVGSIISKEEKFCLDNNIDPTQISDEIGFFSCLNSDLVGIKRFEAAEKLDYVYQMISNNYYNDLRPMINNEKYAGPVLDSIDIRDTLIDICDDLYLLPNDQAVAYGATQCYAMLKTNDVLARFCSVNKYTEEMEDGYDSLMQKHPELDKAYASLKYEEYITDIIPQLEEIEHPKEKEKVLLS